MRLTHLSPIGVAIAIAAVMRCAATLAGCRATMPASYARSPLSPAGEQTKALPEIRRRTLGGTTFSSAEAAAEGKVVVVKFFAEYCAPCKTSLPWLERFARKNPGVAVVGVSEDERESEARALADAYGLTFPIVHDVGTALAGRFRVSEMPVTFVADAQGRIRWVGGPGQTEAQLEAAVSASSR